RTRERSRGPCCTRRPRRRARAPRPPVPVRAPLRAALARRRIESLSWHLFEEVASEDEKYEQAGDDRQRHDEHARRDRRVDPEALEPERHKRANQARDKSRRDEREPEN